MWHIVFFNVRGRAPVEAQMHSQFQKCLEPREHSLVKGTPQALGDKTDPAEAGKSLGIIVGLSHPTRMLGFPGSRVRRP